MKILILLLVLPAIFAQRYRKHVNPNDEPFLPIHPSYPYNPKVAKRGFDKEIVTVLKPELYAPRTDARDSYTGSYAGNPKDSYFPGYVQSPHTSSAAPYSPYSSHYGNSLYYMNPYTANPYSVNPYGNGVQNPNSYPSYYHQPSYYYPDYYNQPFPYSLPSPDNPGPQGAPWNDNFNSNREYISGKSEKPKTSKSKVKENLNTLSSSVGGSRNHYVDGNNFISQTFKDSTPQLNPYKTSNSYNQLEQITDAHFKNVPLPPTTYKVISVGGQLVGPNYPLPSIYAKAQLMEQSGNVKDLAKSLGHLLPHQIIGNQGGTQGISTYIPLQANIMPQNNQYLFLKPDNGEFYYLDENPDGKKIHEGQYYTENFNPASGKSVEAHVYGSDERDLPDKESNNQFISTNQDSSSKLTDLQIYSDRQNLQNNGQTELAAITQTDKSYEMFLQSPAALIKAPSKHQNLPYVQKPGTKVTFQRSQSTYIPPVKIGSVSEEIADLTSVQSFEQPPSMSHSNPYRSEQNYRPDQMQSLLPYQNIGQVIPQAYTYQQTNILPLKSPQEQQVKTNLEDVNFGAKQGNKG